MTSHTLLVVLLEPLYSLFSLLYLFGWFVWELRREKNQRNSYLLHQQIQMVHRYVIHFYNNNIIRFLSFSCFHYLIEMIACDKQMIYPIYFRLTSTMEHLHLTQKALLPLIIQLMLTITMMKKMPGKCQISIMKHIWKVSRKLYKIAYGIIPFNI